MKIQSILLLACAIAANNTVRAAAGETMLFESYSLEVKHSDESFYPVVGIGETTPLILSDEGIVESGRRFIRVRQKRQVNDLNIEILSMDQRDNPNAIILDTTLKSSRPLDGAYAILVYVMEGKGLRAKYEDMPPLTGEVQNIRLRFNNNNVPESGWTVHFYLGQDELYTNQTKGIQEATPLQAFVLQVGRHLTAVGSGSAAPQPFYMPVTKPDPSLLPEGTDPYVVKVKMTIDKTGRISEFSFPEGTSPELRAHLTKNINDWLFFPRIEEGKRVPVTVSLPLQLR